MTTSPRNLLQFDAFRQIGYAFLRVFPCIAARPRRRPPAIDFCCGRLKQLHMNHLHHRKGLCSRSNEIFRIYLTHEDEQLVDLCIRPRVK